MEARAEVLVKRNGLQRQLDQPDIVPGLVATSGARFALYLRE
jgi:hypothetical protein